MTEADALIQLEGMVAASSDPALTDAEVYDLLLRARRSDEFGFFFDEPEWTPTYDLRWAAREGWLLKAGKASPQFSFTTDGQTFHRSELLDHCLQMARRYSSGSSVPLGYPTWLT